ncbi:hypothetical protein F5890DRAFT_1553880 [Lentinula detonsa]|uniref:Uncharacterized protein n=1 Tax=Lentinula detonsa TaxID=2804962 RepID=A0AA38Q0C3_9AGAR|nr:hypothetical protein F5890DRAFT_1553880 [Lentinula detonsa]
MTNIGDTIWMVPTSTPNTPPRPPTTLPSSQGPRTPHVDGPRDMLLTGHNPPFPSDFVQERKGSALISKWRDGNQVILFSCGGRADGSGSVTNSQLLTSTGNSTTIPLLPTNQADTCLFDNNGNLDVTSCDTANPEAEML